MRVHIHEYYEEKRIHYDFFNVKSVATEKDCLLIKTYSDEEYTFNLNTCKLHIFSS